MRDSTKTFVCCSHPFTVGGAVFEWSMYTDSRAVCNNLYVKIPVCTRGVAYHTLNSTESGHGLPSFHVKNGRRESSTKLD